MIFNGIDFPNEIIDAIREDRLVVFAGAGASMGKPTCLPNFESLTDEIVIDTGKEMNRKESCEVFLGSLKADYGVDVNQQAADIILRSCNDYNELHKAIINLFVSPEKVRVITTNYDKMFEKVLESESIQVPIYNAPALPMGDDVR